MRTVKITMGNLYKTHSKQFFNGPAHEVRSLLSLPKETLVELHPVECIDATVMDVPVTVYRIVGRLQSGEQLVAGWQSEAEAMVVARKLGLLGPDLDELEKTLEAMYPYMVEVDPADLRWLIDTAREAQRTV